MRATPLAQITYALSKPLLSRVRGWVPSIRGVDCSPWFVLIALQLVKMLLLAPLSQQALGYLQ